MPSRSCTSRSDPRGRAWPRPARMRPSSAGTDRTVRVWDLGVGHDPVTLFSQVENLSSLAFRPDGRVLATGGGDPPVAIQGPEGKQLAPPQGEGRTIRLWDLASGQELSSL